MELQKQPDRDWPWQRLAALAHPLWTIQRSLVEGTPAHANSECYVAIVLLFYTQTKLT
jgi:hypothetical protein